MDWGRALAWVFVLGVVGVIGGIVVLGYLAIADAGVGGIQGPLHVGDCFVMENDELELAQAVSCDVPHDGEVFFKTDMGEEVTEYPSSADFDDAVQGCTMPFVNYAGVEHLVDPRLQISVVSPTRDGWEAGERTVTCVVQGAAGVQLNYSVRSSTQ